MVPLPVSLTPCTLTSTPREIPNNPDLEAENSSNAGEVPEGDKLGTYTVELSVEQAQVLMH